MVDVIKYRYYIIKMKKDTKKICKRCNNKVYFENNKNIDYPYFCKNCYENMYNFEVKNEI